MDNLWIIPTTLSAFVHGFYDVAKKHAVTRNHLLRVSFLSTMFGALAFTIVALLCSGSFDAVRCTAHEYGLIWIKSGIVAASWICVFMSMSLLPISLAAPIRSTAPLWTLMGSLYLYHEYPSIPQGIGMMLILVGLILFAAVGKKEGFKPSGCGMVTCVLGAMIGSTSALFDKYILGSLHMNRTMMQFHFYADLTIIFGVLVLIDWLIHRARHKAPAIPFQWRWTIPLTGMAVNVSDFLYFYALSMPDTPISLVSMIRRCNVLFSFGFGCLIFHEYSHLKSKSWSLLLILAGAITIALV